MSNVFTNGEDYTGPGDDEASRVSALAGENGWDYLELMALFGYKRDELESGDKSIYGIVCRAVADGDDLEWIEEMVGESLV